MRKILVAVDGSKSAQKAAKKAAELAEDLKAEVTLIHVTRNLLRFQLTSLTKWPLIYLQKQWKRLCLSRKIQ